MHKPKIDILKAKQLKELKLEKKLKIVTKFIEKNIRKYYKIVTR